jgi:hypothetical protein
LSPKLGQLQQAAGYSSDSHNTHMLKGLRASSSLQDVAVDCSNVCDEHAPEHALMWALQSRKSRALRRRSFCYGLLNKVLCFVQFTSLVCTFVVCTFVIDTPQDYDGF